MVTINDIISFVNKAIEKNLDIRTCTRNWDNFEHLSITVYDPEQYPTGITIRYTSENNNSKIQISETYLDWIDAEVSEMDIANFRVLAIKTKEYSKNKAIEKFNNFFNNENTEKIININNLNDDD